MEYACKGKPQKKLQYERRSSRNQIQIAASDKTTSEKANFRFNNVFSIYFKIRLEENYALKTGSFRINQNHFSILTPKNRKMCEPILTKHNRTSLELQSKEVNELMN